jgi:AcrR family transcriptional regulator
MSTEQVGGPGEGERPPTKAAQSAATRDALLRVARRLFAQRGYAAVGTEEIVRAAGVTRGALYHQFADKRELFREVFLQLEVELVAAAAAHMADAPDQLAAFKAGCRGFLEACSTPEAQRIALVDAPAVLGWEQWREIGAQHGLGAVKAVLELGMQDGTLRRQPVEPLAHVLIGALDEAALYVARAADPAAAQAEMETILDRLIDGLRA